MTDFDVVLAKLKNIEDTQKVQGNDIRELSKGFNILATQSEQITNLQTQTATLWKKYDSIVGPDSVQEKIREHQKGCPKDEMNRTFDWMWKAISVHSVLLVTIIGWILFVVVKTNGGGL